MDKAKVSKMGNRKIITIPKSSDLKKGDEVVINRSFIIDEVKRLDPKIKEKDEAFFIATILLSSLQVGANAKEIAEFLKVPIKRIKPYERRLRQSKIWVKGQVGCDWFDKKTGTISFWCDVGVAQGYIKRVEK